MKKLTTLVTAIVLLFSATAFAGNAKNPSENETVKASFKKTFAAASNVNWFKKDDVYFASFTLNNHEAEAAYNENGDLIALSNKIEVSELPLAISVALSDKYGKYTIGSKATEIMYEGQTSYYVNVSNSKQILKLKCSVNGDILVESKQKI